MASSHRMDRLIDWFIPTELLNDREMRQRARMFLLSHLFGPFLGNVIPAYLYILDPASSSTLAILGLSITSFWAYPFILKTTGRYILLVFCSVQNLMFAILWGCFFYGGVSSPFLPWLLVVPLLAFFYLGPTRKSCIMIMSLIGLNLAVFFGLYALGFDFPETIPLRSMQAIGLVSILSASVYVSMMSLFYAKILASQTDLEAEVVGHLQTASELRQATAQAEQASAAKAEFLAKMSHELRTPLNAVIGYSQILLEDTDADAEPQVVADLNKIHNAGRHLLNLVNAILDLSKIEAGRMEVFCERLDLGLLIEDVIGRMQAQAAEKNNRIVADVGPGLNAVWCDAPKLEQIIKSLLDNAVKFTRGGLIQVTAVRLARPDGEVMSIKVQDTGVGISANAIPTLFENFSVNDDTLTKYSGAGLGLPLSVRLCHLLQGSLSVVSQVGVGSEFDVVLPVEPSALSQPPDANVRVYDHSVPLAA